MYRILLASLAVIVALGCSGYYATLTSEEKDHFKAMYERIEELAAEAVIESERAQDAVKRAERAAVRARGPGVKHAEECLAKALGASRIATSGARMIVERASRDLRGLAFHYPTRVKQYTAIERLVEAIRGIADYTERAADCEPEALQSDPPPLPIL